MNFNLNNQKILLYSHYSKTNDVDIYNHDMIINMTKYCDYIFILTNITNIWNFLINELPIYNKYKQQINIIHSDQSTDIGNYHLFISQNYNKLQSISKLYLINDSFLVVNKTLLDKYLNTPINGDFSGICISNEIKLHIQSFLYIFQNTSIKYLLEYFNTNDCPKSWNEACSKFEINITEYLINNNCLLDKNIQIPKHKLNPHIMYSKELLNTKGIIKRQLINRHCVKKDHYGSWKPYILSNNQLLQLCHQYNTNIGLLQYIHKYNSFI